MRHFGYTNCMLYVLLTPLQHYTGLKKVNPPVVQTTSGIPYSDVRVYARNESLAAAQLKDNRWLNLVVI